MLLSEVLPKCLNIRMHEVTAEDVEFTEKQRGHFLKETQKKVRSSTDVSLTYKMAKRPAVKKKKVV